MNRNQKLFLVGAPLLAVILVALRVYYSLAVWTYTGPDKMFDINPGDNFSKINARLSEEGLISSARLFHRYAQYKGVLTKFKSGRYVIKQNSTLLDVYNSLINEKSIANLFTVPEGKNMYEIGKMFEEKGLMTYPEFMALVKDPDFLKSEGIEAETAEGYLFPESYDILPNMKGIEVLRQMIKMYHKKVDGLDFSKTGLSREQALILASMVEKETGDKKERPMIAGVFYNRLKIKMRLQSDPTTIYGMFERYNGKISKNDLLTPSPYNTYTIPALPKGPICNPGLASYNAVINPAKHEYLFFVSMNDGTHVFTKNYEDHQKAVSTWQLNAKNREGRSWRNHHDSN